MSPFWSKNYATKSQNCHPFESPYFLIFFLKIVCLFYRKFLDYKCIKHNIIAMKKFFILSGVSLLSIISCQRSENSDLQEEEIVNSLNCNKTVNNNNVVNYWGVLSRTTCNEGPGSDAGAVSKNSQEKSLLYKDDLNSKATAKAAHFWFYGTTSQRLFKPVTYARVFVFNDDATDQAKINAAKTQIQSGNHYLGFDTGVFKDIYPYVVLNINHKANTNGSITTSYNLESEVKRSLPTGKRIFVQFIVQSSPTNPIPSTFNTAKYAYCEFLNADNSIYEHYKIDLSDSNLGYQGNSFFYN